MRSRAWISLLMVSVLLFAVAPAAASPACPEPVADTVRKLVKEKEAAVNSGDEERFLRVIHPDRRTYWREQKRWFEDAVRYIDPGSFRMEVESIAPERPFRVRALIKQSYRKDGKTRSVRYPLRFEKTEQGWKDSDLPFERMASGDVVVFYTDPRLKKQAAVALDIVSRAVDAFYEKFSWVPAEAVEVKLYHHPELFRQSVKLSLPEWAAGWNEAGQSIKFVGAIQMDDWEESFASGLVHEVTHKMVSERTGDNAAYWLQEGAAEYYQTRLLPGLYSVSDEQRIDRPWRFVVLESLQLEKLPVKEASQYYSQSAALFRFLIERYGEKKIGEVFAVLRQFPVIDRDSTDKIPELNRRTRAAIKKVLGKTMEQLEREWIKEYREGASRGEGMADRFPTEKIGDHFRVDDASNP
ncbi:hypothetical protein CLV97_1221 [Planifilum fimeticola]|uniref:Peptidase MA-like domain-containing protein n=1 Tax=Planifilum fimeticola TaxID=201975 RepID=A0A2T0LCF3_9BACL|nr:hypothetical protein [Planifilum fimeticola]PRX39612.1 hypothetical protein CLV97_1221 [Planifilum fimeticola]